MNYDSKNFIVFIVLAMAIMLGWQFFYVQPRLPKETVQTGTTTTTTATTPTTPATGSATLSRDATLKASPRLAIKSDYVEGSINLQGAQLDDLHLVKYRETIDPQSPTIAFLSPSGTKGALFAEQGFVAGAGTAAKLPDSKTLWTVPAGSELSPGKPVTLSWDNGAGLVFTRTIALDDEYLFTITQSVQNNTAAEVKLIPYARVQRHDTPAIAGYWVFYEGMLGVLGSGSTEVKYKDAAKATEPTAVASDKGGWLGFTDKYWAAVVIPNQEAAVTGTFRYLKLGERDGYQTDYSAKDPIVAAPGASASYRDQFFAGAKVVATINAIGEKYRIRQFDLMIDWGWFKPLTKPMFYLLEWLKSLVGNFGIAILLATVLVKAAVFPLANKSYASMSKMKKLQPEIAKLKELYPDDRVKQQQGMMELYKREKVSPLSGCLPVLVQVPVFFSLYKVILTSIELRQAPFYGWIHDLSAPDPTSFANLFGLLPFTPPAMLMIGVWPLLMGITMWLQMRLNPTPPDPVQASLFNWMPVIFTFMLGTFPVGLVIYWAWSNTLSVIQQSIIMRRHGVEVNFLGNIRASLPFLNKKPAA
ncbi:MAG: membrane protein insertase YidC [Rhizobiales bacterium]|nr:membrane protein insertase YidC [Hyphomicrobiales bacterium]MBI3673433.1 membrane protein insertase YidC [Hyphomicrobiales bacterium]